MLVAYPTLSGRVEISLMLKLSSWKLDIFQMMKSFVKNPYEYDFTGTLPEDDEIKIDY